MKRWFNCWVRSPFFLNKGLRPEILWSQLWRCTLHSDFHDCKRLYCICIRTFFFLHRLKRWYAIRFVCLEYFIFRYCFLTHVAVHISFPLFKLKSFTVTNLSADSLIDLKDHEDTSLIYICICFTLFVNKYES